MGYPVVGTVRRYRNVFRENITCSLWSPTELFRSLDTMRADLGRIVEDNPTAMVTVTYDDAAVWFEVDVPELWTEADVVAEKAKHTRHYRREFLLSQQRSLAQAIGFKVARGEPYELLLADLERNKAELAALD